MTSPIPEPAFDVFSAHCPSREVMQHVTGRWGALVLIALGDGSLRFSALRRRIDGVSDRLLSQTLRRLEEDGLVRRHDRGTAPPHVEYALTLQGQQVSPKLTALIETLQAIMPGVVAGRS